MNLLLDLYLTWFKLGLFTFGGGYAMLPLIQREIIDNKKWATEEEVMNYYAIGQITPGIIAVNTATFIGYYKKGVIGGIVATLGVISPSLIIITLIANLINNFSELIIVQHALSGIKVAVTCLMLIAIKNLYKSNVKDISSLLIAISTFVLSYFTSISTTLLVVSAGVIGIVFTKLNLFRKDKS